MYSKNKFIVLIPARKGSKGVKNKNIKKINNLPLIAYSILTAKLLSNIDEIIVSTNCKKIALIARKYGAITPFLRPDDISKDNSLDIEFFNHFINFYKKNKFDLPEYIIHLSPTVPFRNINVMNRAIKKIKSDKTATALRSVHLSHVSPEKMFFEKNNKLVGYFPSLKGEYYNMPRQIYRKALIPNGQIDIIRTKYITKKSLHGNKLIPFITSTAPNIDTMNDFNDAKKYLEDKKLHKLYDF